MEMFPREHRVHFAVIESTHAYAVSNGLSLPEGSVVTADYQTSGRGRAGRRWSASPKSSVLASAVLRSRLETKTSNLLIHVAALSVAELVQKLGLTPAIKWPNDILVSDKKIAGVLAETSLRGSRIDFAVLSAGINLNQTTAELSGIDVPATSVFGETGRTSDVEAVLDEFLLMLEENVRHFFEAGSPPIMQRWMTFECLRGTSVRLDTGRDIVEGIADGYDADGALILSDGTKEIGRFKAGDIVSASA